MFENIARFFKKLMKTESPEASSKETAKERLHLVLMQDRANVSADFLEMMKQEIIEVIKKYIDVDENAIDVRLTNKANDDGTNGAPALYANIPIISIKDDKKEEVEEPKKPKQNTEKQTVEENKEAKKENKEDSMEEKVEEVKEEKNTTEENSSEETEKESTDDSTEVKEENVEVDSVNQ